MTPYKSVQAAKILGVSDSALRNYTTTYARYLSTEATGSPRLYTEADLRLFAFVVERTKTQGQTHAQVLDALQDGELESFDWQPPPDPEQTITDLVPMALVLEARRREQEAIAQAQAEVEALRWRVEDLQLELGRAQGELAAVQRQVESSRRRPPAWWVKLFGGRE